VTIFRRSVRSRENHTRRVTWPSTARPAHHLAAARSRPCCLSARTRRSKQAGRDVRSQAPCRRACRNQVRSPWVASSRTYGQAERRRRGHQAARDWDANLHPVLRRCSLTRRRIENKTKATPGRCGHEPQRCLHRCAPSRAHFIDMSLSSLFIRNILTILRAIHGRERRRVANGPPRARAVALSRARPSPSRFLSPTGETSIRLSTSFAEGLQTSSISGDEHRFRASDPRDRPGAKARMNSMLAAPQRIGRHTSGLSRRTSHPSTETPALWPLRVRWYCVQPSNAKRLRETQRRPARDLNTGERCWVVSDRG
jgi:hypothetical protein